MPQNLFRVRLIQSCAWLVATLSPDAIRPTLMPLISYFVILYTSRRRFAQVPLLKNFRCPFSPAPPLCLRGPQFLPRSTYLLFFASLRPTPSLASDIPYDSPPPAAGFLPLCSSDSPTHPGCGFQ